MWKIRLRPSGATISVSQTDSISTLLQKIQEGANLFGEFQVKHGYPPKALEWSSFNSTIQECGLTNGSVLIIEPSKESVSSTSNSTITITISSSTSNSNLNSTLKANPMPIAKNTSTPAQSSLYSGSTSSSAPSQDHSSTLPLLIVGIKDDNSCLFHAISFCVTEQARSPMQNAISSSQAIEFMKTGTKHPANVRLSLAKELRELVAITVISAADKYAPLIESGRSPDEYSKYITRSDTWGGAVECAILAEYFGIEIAAVDVETGNVYNYGEDKHYDQRCYLLYTGIHYDCLVDPLSSTGNLGNNRGQTLFPTKSASVHLERAKHAAELCRKKHGFTNVRTFTLRCCDCNQPLKGAAEATEHANLTKHQRFEEYSK